MYGGWYDSSPLNPIRFSESKKIHLVGCNNVDNIAMLRISHHCLWITHGLFFAVMRSTSPRYLVVGKPNRMHDRSYIQLGTVARHRNALMPSNRYLHTASIAYFLLFLAGAGTPPSFGAELFPFSPPSDQQRYGDQSAQMRPQLSMEDIHRATQLIEKAKTLPLNEQRQFQESIRSKQKDALRKGNISQAQYYAELLTQLGQGNR